MRKAPLIALVTIGLIISACAPKVDSSSQEKFKASIEKIEQALPEKDKSKFQEALTTILFSELDFSKLLSGSASVDKTSETAMQKLDGKTAKEIFALSDSINKAKAAKEKAQALLEIKELEQKMEAAKTARIEIAKFSVQESRFSISTDMIGMRHPAIKLKIKNGTNRAVSRAYFVGTLASPGRQVPWVKESFNYQIPGGVEPGEEITWNLEPNMFSEWGKASPDNGAILTVEVVKLEDASGIAFLDAQFDDADQERLVQLKSNFK